MSQGGGKMNHNKLYYHNHPYIKANKTWTKANAANAAQADSSVSSIIYNDLC